jgi:tetratricopeptide (TPR) repeat protein
VALATLGKHKQALINLQEVEKGIASNDFFDNHIELFTILADAYYQLKDYRTALTLQLKILKLRVELQQKNNIEKTYLSIGYANFYLQRFDDAYNAFWEASYYAEKKFAPISAAYAKKGLGIALLKQTQYEESIAPLQEAANIFEMRSLSIDLIETLIALAKANVHVNEKEQGYLLLEKVLTLLNGDVVSLEYTGFYRMLAEMYFDKQLYQKAYFWQEKHSELLLIKVKNNKKAVNTAHQFYNQSSNLLLDEEPLIQSRELAVKLAENNELSNDFVDKINHKKVIINSLVALVFLQFITILSFIFKLRSKKRALVYEDQKDPSYVLASAMQTKHDYQLAFKKSRLYQYPLTVSYVVIENWQELTFLCSKKVLREIKRDIANVFNEQLTEFDQGGLLNDGEYLLLFEHQKEQDVQKKVETLAQDLQARFFANLGDFSVAINYGLKKPDFKDIDPYIFLARLCESVTSTKAMAK